MGLTSCTSAGPAPVWENQVLKDLLSFIIIIPPVPLTDKGIVNSIVPAPGPLTLAHTRNSPVGPVVSVIEVGADPATSIITAVKRDCSLLHKTSVKTIKLLLMIPEIIAR